MDNFENIERDWKSGEYSNVVIGRRNDVTEGCVRKLAKQYAWQRGTPVAPAPTPPLPSAALQRVPMPAARLSGKPADKERAVDLLNRMLDELDAITSHIGEIEELINTETENDRNINRRIAMMKAVSLPVRADTLKKLISALGAGTEVSATEKMGKKAQQDTAARQVASGKFAPAAAPLRVVGGK